MSACVIPVEKNTIKDEINLLELKELEINDLISPSEACNIYEQLMFKYILSKDLISAKFLWKRIPSQFKTENATVSILWKLGQSIWYSNFSLLHSFAVSVLNDQNTSDDVKNLVSQIVGAYRERVLKQLQHIYSTIEAKELENCLGLQPDEIEQALLCIKWEKHGDKYYIPPELVPVMPSKIDNNELISQFTKLMSFIENH